ncbi:hypothetical protein GCM10023189_49090 [Nibrella saemangeumensis]|uniref:Outer membrane protein beta-barrel domain-containing protein n=1 Tax=Nibrella saemangeumensis TaxID=1084526 RepID=A0ABP8NJ06_9BACT
MSSAQSLYDYYLPGKERRNFEKWGFKNGYRVTERWYLSGEGFLRTDNSRLDNSFNGLLSSRPVTRTGWSALIGFTDRDQWGLEWGYARSPINSSLTINSRPEYTLRLQNEKNGFVFRSRYMILSTSRKERRSGFWLTAGAWLIPNAGSVRSFTLEGLGYRGFRQTPDTLLLISRTSTNREPSGLLELGLEYNVRLSGRWDVGLVARRNWGLGNSLKTDFTYRVNTQPYQIASLRANGDGMSFGLAVRYTYTARYKVKTRSLYDLQGKMPRKK